jgi:hypothetical protein
MDRREALKFVGYTLTIGTTAAILDGCKADKSTGWVPKTFSTEEGDLMAEICESIFPKTDTPGAKDALCHRWIDEYVTIFRSDEEKKHLKEGLKSFDTHAKAKFSKAFVSLNPTEKEEVLAILFKECQDYKDDTGKKPHIFKFMRENTISGYFTSEVGAKGGLLDYKPVPGPYQGCIPYTATSKAYVL